MHENLVRALEQGLVRPLLQVTGSCMGEDLGTRVGGDKALSITLIHRLEYVYHEIEQPTTQYPLYLVSQIIIHIIICYHLWGLNSKLWNKLILVMYVHYNGSTVFSICRALHPALANWWQRLALLSDRWQLVQQRALWRQWSLQESIDWPFFVWDPCYAPAFSSWEPPEDIQSETINPSMKPCLQCLVYTIWENCIL